MVFAAVWTSKLWMMLDGSIINKYVVIGRFGSPIRRVVATCHSEGVRLQSWVTRHSYIVARSTERTRTLIFWGEYIQDTGRNISSSRLHFFCPYFSPQQWLYIVFFLRAYTLRDASWRAGMQRNRSFERKWLNSSEPSSERFLRLNNSYCLTFCKYIWINNQNYIYIYKKKIVMWSRAFYAVLKLCFIGLCSSLLVPDAYRLIYRLLLIKRWFWTHGSDARSVSHRFGETGTTAQHVSSAARANACCGLTDVSEHHVKACVNSEVERRMDSDVFIHH